MEVAIAGILIVLALALLLEVPSGEISQAQQYFGILTLLVIFVFIHFQFFNIKTTPRTQKTKHVIIHGQRELDSQLKTGAKFVSKIGEDTFVVESSSKNKGEGTSPQ